MTLSGKYLNWAARAVSLISLLLLLAPQTGASPSAPRPRNRKPWAVDGLSPQVLRLALRAVESANKQGIGRGRLLAIIDFSLPSTRPRLWVLDLERQKVRFHELVAHGKRSGGTEATSFSNERESLKSSLGLYQTGSTYMGENGYSLRLRGLEPGVNDNARVRTIVMHGAWYVSQEMIDKHGRLGRSWGCPAVRKSVAKPLIDTLKDGHLLFAYFPDKHWLSTSRFLNP